MRVVEGRAFGGEAHMNGVSALIKEAPERSPALSAMGGDSEKTAILKQDVYLP
jgi:hypothetical protein